MEKPIQKINENKLQLISKSRNKAGAAVFREDLPSVLFYKSPRILLGSNWFNSYTKGKTTKFCETCMKQAPLERHELYGLYKYGNYYIIKLEGVIKICKDCHQKIHGGFSTRMNMGYGFVRQPVPVSDALSAKKYPWNLATFLCVDGQLYPL